MAQTAGGTYYAASSELVSSWPATSLDLANQLETRFAAKYTTGGAWTAWNPTFRGSTTNPTLGTGGSCSGAYIQIGKIVFWRLNVVFGNSGVAAGSGSYYVTAPTAAKVNDLPVGYAVIYDSSTTNTYTAVCGIYGGSDIYIKYTAGSYGNVGAAAPMAFANQDNILMGGTYEAA